MLSLFKALLLSHLLVVSDRDHFLDANKISNKTLVAWDSLKEEPAIDPKDCKGKKILVVVHGFNNTSTEAISTYRTVTDHIGLLKGVKGEALYDVVIGYLWPGYQDRLEYYEARRHARALKQKMLKHLELLSSLGAKVDVMAHSMGNRLVFEALNFSPKKGEKKLVENLFSLAAAVDNESLEKREKYFHVTKNCENIFVFHSKRDEVLEFLYSIAEWDKALGFEGAENIKKLPKNIQLIDCTAFVSGHSQYFSASSIYEFIQSELLKQTPSSQKAPRLKLSGDGKVEIIPTEIIKLKK